MFYVGQKVKYYQWNGGAPEIGDVGVVTKVWGDNKVVVDFPSQSGWLGGDYCVRPLEEEMDEEVYY